MNIKYFSIRKAAHDNTCHLYQPETDLYTELFGKNIQMFRKWAYEGNINAIKIDNQFHVFYDTYNLLVDIVRNNQAAEYLGISRTTLARLKKDGILNVLSIPKTKTSFLSFQEISNPKIIRVVELRKRKGNRYESVIPIDKLQYRTFK